jgi:hypothetical protein
LGAALVKLAEVHLSSLPRSKSLHPGNVWKLLMSYSELEAIHKFFFWFQNTVTSHAPLTAQNGQRAGPLVMLLGYVPAMKVNSPK